MRPVLPSASPLGQNAPAIASVRTMTRPLPSRSLSVKSRPRSRGIPEGLEIPRTDHFDADRRRGREINQRRSSPDDRAIDSSADPLERHQVRLGDRHHTRNGLDLRNQAIVEHRNLIGRGKLRIRPGEIDHHQVVGSESQIEMPQVEHAAEEQARGEQHDERQSNLKHDQAISEAAPTSRLTDRSVTSDEL